VVEPISSSEKINGRSNSVVIEIEEENLFNKTPSEKSS
jgi:hypothetical protein